MEGFQAVQRDRGEKAQAQLPSPTVLAVAWILSLVIFVDGVSAVGPEVVFWWRMRGAIPVHGTVMKLKMSPPDPSDFGIDVEYGYEVNGRSYVGSRVAIHAYREYGGDTIQRRLWAQLQEAESRKEQITVYVNPDEPSVSALDLTLRWSNLSLILASLFPTVLTTGITLWCLLHRRRGSGALTR